MSAHSLLEAAAAWDALADDERRARQMGICLVPDSSQARERTYERTAEALRFQARTGVAVCSCCFKPLDGKPPILMSQNDIDILTKKPLAP